MSPILAVTKPVEGVEVIHPCGESRNQASALTFPVNSLSCPLDLQKFQIVNFSWCQKPRRGFGHPASESDGHSMTGKPVLSLLLDRQSSTSLQEQLAVSLKARILEGKLFPGEPIPSSRELARDLGLSRNTVVSACDRLLGEGYLESSVRSGLFVSSQLAIAGKSGSSRTPPAKTSRSDSNSAATGIARPVPFRACRPDMNLFPLARWNRHRNRVLKKFGSALLDYQSTCACGWPELRQAIALYLTESRGVACHWTQVAITSGSQQALFLLSHLLVKSGDRVMLEDPGYLGAREVFSSVRSKIVRLPVDRLGAIPPEKYSRIRLIYSTPSRQFPTGASLPVARRMALLNFAARSGAWLLEDDYDSEFRYAGPPLPSLHSLDRSGRVIYLGTMSKVLSPGLRIGYVVLPPELVGPFSDLKKIVDDHGPLIDQATLASFISSGDFYSHIRRCRKVYARRLEVFLDAARKHDLPLDFPHTDGGMNQTGFFRDAELDAQQISQKLAATGFDLPATSGFSIRPTQPGLVFGFTAFDEDTIKTSIASLSRLLNSPSWLASTRKESVSKSAVTR